MSVQTIDKILRNVFYCGYVSCSLVEGLIPDMHESIITEDVFLEVNDLKKSLFG